VGPADTRLSVGEQGRVKGIQEKSNAFVVESMEALTMYVGWYLVVVIIRTSWGRDRIYSSGLVGKNARVPAQYATDRATGHESEGCGFRN
jgi:hypothetical protein